MRPIRVPLFLICTALFSAGCGSENPAAGTESLLTGTVDHHAGQILISSQSASLRGDGGFSVQMDGEFNTEPFQLLITVSGGVSVGPGTLLQIGGSGINVRMEAGGTIYRGTSGSLTFTASDPVSGGTMAGSFEIGLVGLVLNPAKAATLTGGFSAVAN